MSGAKDDDERRRRSMESSRELLEKSGKTKALDRTQLDDMSDEESSHHDKSIDPRESSVHEGLSSQDVTHSSISMSEGEAEGDLEGLVGRVAALEELLHGKEAIVEALNAEIDHLRAEDSSPNSSQSQASSLQGKDVIYLYHSKLQEFEKAIEQRNNMIEELTCSLEQALSMRDKLLAQLNSINAMQLTSPNSTNAPMQEKIDTLETVVSDQKSVIQRLNTELTQVREHVLEIELEIEKGTRNPEINDDKLQITSSNEQTHLGTQDKNLNIAGTVEQQKQYEMRIEKIKQDMQHIANKFTEKTNANAERHQQELNSLNEKHEAEIMHIKMKYEEYTKSLKEENKALNDRLNKELPDLESRHAKELSLFQSQLSYYKKTVESLKHELESSSEALKIAQAEAARHRSDADEVQIRMERSRRTIELNYEKEKEMLNEQIRLHKIQLEELTAKCTTMTAILESKESIERSLEQAQANAAALKEENKSLQFQLNDISSRYSAAESVIENNQAHERLLSSRIFDLEKSLTRFSGVNVSMLSELNETTYQKFDEAAAKYHFTKNKLEEKEELEKKLVEKINSLESEFQKSKEELEEANRIRKSYEKQLKDMKNTCDKYKSEINMLKESNSSGVNDNRKDLLSDSLKKIEEDKQELKSLKALLEEKEEEISDYLKQLSEMSEKVRKSEKDCEQLKNGLTFAWSQCAEVEQKLSQSVALQDSELDASLSASNYGSALIKQLINKLNDSTFCDEKIDLNKSVRDRDLVQDEGALSYLQSKFDIVAEENRRLITELREKESRYKQTEKNLRIKLEDANSLQDSINQLRKEKDTMRKKVEELVAVHEEQLSAIKAETSAEFKKMEALLLRIKEENIGNLSKQKEELETRHTKEVEELRTYFEQKCRDMEKQYSEEVFSQRSKKMSDNDSEIEQLTDNIYYSGGGDCLNVSNLSSSVSREDSPFGMDPCSQKPQNPETQMKTEFENEKTIASLQQELERRLTEIQEIRMNYEKILRDQKDQYEQTLREQCEKRDMSLLRNLVNQHCQTEWDAGALENGELSKLRAEYNHQLEEQITLARSDIITALQEEIQTLLAVESDGDENLSSELQQLHDKLMSNAKREIEQLKDAHLTEVAQLKEEHARNTARIIARHEEEIGRIKVERSSYRYGDRDNLHRVCATVKALVEELIKYFVICEEEVNNTLVTEVLKRQLSESLCNVQKAELPEETDSSREPIAENSSSDSSSNIPEVRIKRVHFAPRSTEIVSILKSDMDDLETILEEREDITEKLKGELDGCLRRLKLESAEILGISLSGDAEDQLGILAKEIMDTNKLNEELTLKLNHAENLILEYQEESEQLKLTVAELQRKFLQIQNKKEIITEGYGENDDGGCDVTLQDFSQLQERARLALSNGGGDCTYLLQLIEELCRQSDKLMEDSRKEKEDLQQQVPLEPTPPPYIHRVCCRKIIAADKQLRSTRKFLDEQASERELERDEAAKEIHRLQEQLKEREREKERDMRMTSESSLSPESSSDVPALQATVTNAAVEALESQMREMTSSISAVEAKKVETESELEDAVRKIWILREIIADLERQLQQKKNDEESLQMQISQLKMVIAAQTENQQDLVKQLDAIKMGAESRELNEHINHLQEELRKHKLSSEQFNVNSAVLQQMRMELREMQNQVDKRIKDLETTHLCGSTLSLSQPSEDVSIRDHIDASRCPTPDDPNSPPVLPLDQLLKLKEKMLKHARAEDVALKRIKDLEMQLNRLKTQNEELLEEQEILQQTASEQLYQIEAIRGRLEQHKQSAPFAQRQATSRLELQLHEANTKFQSLERTIAEKDLELKDMRNQIDRVNQLLSEKEAEIKNVVQMENSTIKKLKDRLEVVEEEKKILEAKLGLQQHSQTELPQLIDNMLADKNEEIDHLKEQLTKKEKQLEMYTSLVLDDAQLRELGKQGEPKHSARTLSDILSIHSECEELEGIRTTVNFTQTHNMSSFKIPGTLKDTLDGSVNPSPGLATYDSNKHPVQVPPLDLGSNSQSTSNSIPQNVSLGVESGRLSGESESKKSEIESVQLLGRSTDDPSNELTSESDKFRVSVTAKSTQTSLNESRKKLEEFETQLQEVQEDLRLKTCLLEKSETELAMLKKIHDELQVEFKDTVDTLTRDRSFYQNQYELSLASENKIKKDLLEVENTVKLQAIEIEDHKSKMQMNEKIITELNSEMNKLRREVELAREEISMKERLLQEKMKELQNLRGAILEKDVTIETIQTRNIEIENENKQLYEFKTKYETCRKQIAEYQNDIHRLTEKINNRDRMIMRLEEMAKRASLSTSPNSDEKHPEVVHLQECLREKDKVIWQMSEDCKSLHQALQTIRNKMKETGNIVELRKQLKDERKLNTELRSAVEKLGKELDDFKQPVMQRSQEDTDIEDMIQRELNLSAYLDRQIMNAIEGDADEGRNQNQLDGATTQMDGKLQLKMANKYNEELKKMKDDLEVKKDVLEYQIVEYENRIFQLKADLEEEYKKVAKLDKELSAEKHLVRTLKIQIERDQRAMQTAHYQDAELIDLLREKLKSSMESESKLRNELSLLRQENKALEIRLSSIKEHLQSQKSDEEPKIAEVLENERKKYMSLMEKFEKEERNNIELRDILKGAEMEKNCYKKQLELEMDEKEKLISSLALIEGIKEHLDSDLRRTKVALKTRDEECEWLQKRIKTMIDAEEKRQEQRTNEHTELKSLRRELNNAREFMADLEADMKQSKRECAEAEERERKLELALKALQERETELIEKLTAARVEDKKSKETIQDLQQLLRSSSRKQGDIQKQLRGGYYSEKNTPEALKEKILELMDTNERHMDEKNILRDKLLKVREDKEQLIKRVKSLESQLRQFSGVQELNLKNPVFIKKLEYFCANYLRAESMRKALTFQKGMLLKMVSGHEIFEENQYHMLLRLVSDNSTSNSSSTRGKNKLKPKRFKCAALVIVSIRRMKWLIQKLRHKKDAQIRALLSDSEPTFIPIRRGALNHSPPVRERPSTNGGGMGLTNFGLDQYYHRLRNIQDTLGLAMTDIDARPIIPE